MTAVFPIMPVQVSPSENALANLPNGEAFRFVDDITHLEPGVLGIGSYTISGEEPFLMGHLPGNPTMPAVIMVEALAQLGSIVTQSDPRAATLTDLRLSAMKNVKIFDIAVPGDTLQIRTRIAGRLGNLIQIEGRVECEDRQLVTAQITLSGTLAE